jgi:D-alanyl-D-alanine carboxypeptidase/D-alanyl-D-alanine-endopeptidase (penicillin-binding protein 4)
MMLSRRSLLAGMAVLALPMRLRADPAASIGAAKLGADVAFAALDATSGTLLAAREADQPMAPASTLKIVTALYALDRLGAGHRFATRVLAAGDTLILAGGGDPVLDSDDLAGLAVQVAQAWQGPPPARFLVWGGALPHVARLDPAQDEYLPYNPTLSGMMLNFNRVHLDWRSGQMALQARGRRQSPRAYSITIAGVARSSPLFTYDGSGPRESWTIARGAMGAQGARWLPVRQPELYAGDVFQTLCRAQGLALPDPERGDLAPTGHEIARHDSPPLDRILRGMLEYSTNLTAEALGLAASSAGDLRASAQAMVQWLAARDPQARAELYDHSGLSSRNRISPLTLARLLQGEGRARDLAALLKHVPLRDAKGKKTASPLQILAKTGTLNFVSNLAGYAKDAAGREIAFVIFAADENRRAASEGQELPDGVIGWTKRAKALQQALVEDFLATA